MKNNPYIGPRPYERRHRDRFYGRTREARDLLALIMAEPVVLFYAESGAGKSSLLNAMIIPNLEDQGFNVLPVARVGSDVPPGLAKESVPNIFVFSTLMTLAGDQVPGAGLAAARLADYLRERTAGVLDENGDPRPPILIVDQFEEILTTHRECWQDAQGFFEQLQQALHDVPHLSVVLSMREDHVAGLDPYAPLLPRRLRARFRMERLGVEGALEAVRRPAEKAGAPFEPGAAERLVDDLRRIKTARDAGGADDRGADAGGADTGGADAGSAGAGHAAPVLGPVVEPVQLQVVCNQLWENLPERSPQNPLIRWEEVQQFGDIDRALTAFYESALAQVVAGCGVKEHDLREWFGTQLITPMQTRGMALRGQADTAGLANGAVDMLESRHIIRAEARAGAYWYELCHDRMVDPILVANRNWESARQTSLRMTAERWKATGDKNLLYRGKALAEARVQAQQQPDALDELEHEFVQAGLHAEKTARRLRVLEAAGVVLAVLVIAVMGALAWLAYREQRRAQSKGLAVMAMRELDVNQERSVLVARAALDEYDTLDARNALRQAVDNYHPATVLSAAQVGDVVYTLAYSPDGSTLAAGLANGKVRVWKTGTWQALYAIQPGKGSIWSLQYSRDGRTLAAAASDKAIYLLDAATGATTRKLSGHTAPVYAIRYSPDGSLLASAGEDRTVRVWELSSGRAVTISGHSAAARTVDFNPRGDLLAAGWFDNSIDLLRVSAGANGLHVEKVNTLFGHTDAVNRVLFSPDGTLLASAATDRTIRLWDVQTGREVLTLASHSMEVRDLAFSRDGALLVSSSRDTTVRVWDVAHRNPDALVVLTGHTSTVNAVALSPDGRFVASGSGDQTIRIADLQPPQGAAVSALQGHSDNVRSVAYSPDGRFIASASKDGTVRVWEAAGGTLRFVVPSQGKELWSVAYSPDGRRLAACSSDGHTFIWDVASGARAVPVVDLYARQADIESAAFSPDGKLLATGSDDRTVSLWDTGTWQRVAVLKGHKDWVDSVAFSPDGSLLASGSSDNSVRIWDVAARTTVITLTGHTRDVVSVAFSPDGKSVASGSWDETARIWDLKSGASQVLTGHSGYVYAVAFSPDGRTLASGSRDRSVRLWDMTVTPAGPAGLLQVPRGSVRGVAFSPDGKYLVAALEDRTVRRYLARFEDVLALARAYVPQDMSPAERDALIGP